MFRPGRSANLHDSVKHGEPKTRRAPRGAADAVSRHADARVLDVVTSGKWLVRLTGEVPRPSSALATGKSDHKSVTKGTTTRRRGVEDPPNLPDLLKGLQQIRSSEGKTFGERRNLREQDEQSRHMRTVSTSLAASK